MENGDHFALLQTTEKMNRCVNGDKHLTNNLKTNMNFSRTNYVKPN